MKSSIHILTVAVAFLMLGTIPSCKKESSTNQCTDKRLDGSETEIDCGGSCSPCPSVQAISATYDGNPYVATSISATYAPSTDAVNIGSQGSAGASVLFGFVNSNPGSASVTGARIDFNGIQYDMNPSQPGTLNITSKDSLRNIISGTFNINMLKSGTGDHSVLAGTFTNIRMQ